MVRRTLSQKSNVLGDGESEMCIVRALYSRVDAL